MLTLFLSALSNLIPVVLFRLILIPHDMREYIHSIACYQLPTAVHLHLNKIHEMCWSYFVRTDLRDLSNDGDSAHCM